MAQVDSENNIAAPARDADALFRRTDISPETVTMARRNFLGSAVAALAAGAAVNITAIAATSPATAAYDPIFELIAAHRKAYAEFLAALAERNRLEELGDDPRHEDFEADQCTAATDALYTLVDANPTTFAGLVALITHLKEFSETEGWMFEDGGMALPLIANLAQALPRLAVS